MVSSLYNTNDGARLDIAANGFWGGRCEKKYVDAKVFNPHAPTNCSNISKAVYRRHEISKKRSYEARIHEVEHGTFTPLILSATGGMADEDTKCLASLLSDKCDTPYAAVLGWVRCCLSFSRFQSSIRCIHGSRSSRGSFGQSLTALLIDLVQSEAKLFSFL